jgi:hypothetical protein
MQIPSKRARLLQGWRLWTRAVVVAAVVAGVAFAFAPSSSAAEQSSEAAAARSESASTTAALPLCTIDRYFGDEYGNREGIILPAARGGSTSCLIGDGLVGCSNCSGIAALQRGLNRCNPEGQKARVNVDGSWGPKTKEALKRTQRHLGLRADGVYGPATRDAMKWKTLKGCAHVPSKKS